MLQDFDGLQRRIMQLYRERMNCNDVILTRDAEIAELQDQLDAREKVVSEVETINNRNLDEYLRTMQEMKSDKDMMDTQSTARIDKLQD